jgi:hypothetical protein
MIVQAGSIAAIFPTIFDLGRSISLWVPARPKRTLRSNIAECGGGMKKWPAPG